MENLPVKPEDSVSAFLSAHGGPAGEFLKFGKAGTFVRVSDEEEVPEGTKLICVYDQAQHGWIKFNGKGEPPDRRMGPRTCGPLEEAITCLVGAILLEQNDEWAVQRGRLPAIGT